MTDRIEQLRRMLESDPTDPFCLYALGMEYASSDHPEKAIAHLEQSLSMDEAQPWAWYHIARCKLATGATNEAAQAIDTGLQVAHDAGDHSAVGDLEALRAQCDV
ncbi:MAG: tetratricopeptide repeat protein [Phycisphaerales bacterium]|nr:tetratricopeptide repeat protein [Phycisphaerales bacterium]